MDTPEEYAASLRRAEAIEKRMRKSYILAHKRRPEFDEDWMEITDNLYRLVKKYGIETIVELLERDMG